MHRHIVGDSNGDHFVVSYEGELVSELTLDYYTLLAALDARGTEYEIEEV